MIFLIILPRPILTHTYRFKRNRRQLVTPIVFARAILFDFCDQNILLNYFLSRYYEKLKHIESVRPFLAVKVRTRLSV